MKKTWIGIVNPDGATETFCTSAIEFGMNRVPVIGGKYGGLINTVPKNCGYLVFTKRQLLKKMFFLTKNKQKNLDFGMNHHNNSVQYTFENFSKTWKIQLLKPNLIGCKRRWLYFPLYVTKMLFLKVFNFLKRVAHFAKRKYILKRVNKYGYNEL